MVPESLQQEIKAAKEKVRVAEQNYDNAGPKHFEIALEKLNQAEAELNTLLKQAKLEEEYEYV